MKTLSAEITFKLHLNIKAFSRTFQVLSNESLHLAHNE